MPAQHQAKKESFDRRVILDLSLPIGHSTNDGIPKDTYLGLKANLTFSRTDDFAFRIYQLGTGCYMFKIDLCRYFRQIPLDPRDYYLIYFDKVLPIGLRSAPYIAQRITNAIKCLHSQLAFFLLNYVDYFMEQSTRTKYWIPNQLNF